ncbi:maleylpyruvate isomerase family mycothiol-dependent enzyme [[Mycobacterium] nativiensis]|uniref:Maleylpyruvate isomerase family mycothiol-dependent enzyme n=1 Tax=[Mycobacterium] nativiensis TaxID=2855503 RepID=A0ABU5XRR4_9MYCO|nr:maleylpyruvate isomerase family mycothiol-dependent enzyme [Mycolicibacter sp. MYC340]MEB3030625.1 maleylpyruvate isomerase family mycothiol-dependent enzyme [Mycolicibacter sp. MYC340]
MTLTGDIQSERAALADSLSAAGASAHAGCGSWTALDLAAHLVAEERIAGLSTFIARSLVVRGIAVPAPPKMVDFAIRREYHLGFTGLLDRLRRPVPRLLLRPRVAPLTLFEYWTHHDDLVGGGAGAHPAPPTLVEVIPPLLRYQLNKLPTGVGVTVGTENGSLHSSVGPESGPMVIVAGTPANLVRWLAGRTGYDVGMSGPDAHVQALRSFNGHV